MTAPGRPAKTKQRSRCRRCGHSFAERRKPSYLPAFALTLLAVVAFYAAVAVGLLYGPLYGAGLLFVWYGLCLAAFRTYERGRS